MGGLRTFRGLASPEEFPVIVMRLDRRLLLVSFAGLGAPTLLGACGQDSDRQRVDPNGFMFGDRRKDRTLVVGVGDTTDRLIRHNPYLRGAVGTPTNGELRLMAMENTSLEYDDGDLKLTLPDVAEFSVDGNGYFPHGAAFVGLRLAEQPKNDYRRALELASQVIQALEQQSPSAVTWRGFYEASDEATLKRVHSWWRKSTSRGNLLTLAEAESKFAQQEREGYGEIVNARAQGLGAGSYAKLALYAGRTSTFELGVANAPFFGGDDLTPEERRAMRYTVTMNFALREDVDLATAVRS
jgi:hypothetical protein